MELTPMAAVAVTPSHCMPRDLPLAQVVDRCHATTGALRQALQTFWGVGTTVRLVAVSQHNLYFWRADDFFVTQLSLGEAPEDVTQLRLCETGCQGLLDTTLGLRDAPGDAGSFSLNRVSALESQILTGFCKEAFDALSPALIRRKRSRRLQPGWLHVCWAFRLARPVGARAGDETLGKLILTIPRQAFLLAKDDVAASAPPPTRAPLEDSFFLHVRQTVRLWVGRTRLSLQDLEQLEAGDLVVLSDSRADRLAYQEPGSDRRFPFGARLTRLAGLALHNAQESRVMESSPPLPHPSQIGRASKAREQLWSNLPIEVHAEFAPVRLPLRQVKQMTEGLIVEVGDLTANRIRLHVEGKTVAVGELVIVGDRFGVRISRVGEETLEAPAEETTLHLPAAPSAVSPAQKPVARETEPPAPPVAETGDSDAFDNWVESEDDSWLADDDDFDEEDA